MSVFPFTFRYILSLLPTRVYTLGRRLHVVEATGVGVRGVACVLEPRWDGQLLRPLVGPKQALQAVESQPCLRRPQKLGSVGVKASISCCGRIAFIFHSLAIVPVARLMV